MINKAVHTMFNSDPDYTPERVRPSRMRVSGVLFEAVTPYRGELCRYASDTSTNICESRILLFEIDNGKQWGALCAVGLVAYGATPEEALLGAALKWRSHLVYKLAEVERWLG
jgi:hypothetical protein